MKLHLLLLSLFCFKMIDGYTLKKAADTDIPTVHALLAECGLYMHRTLNLHHWHPYMPLENFQQRMKSAQLYGIYEGDRLIGTFNLCPSPRTYYTLDMWENPEAKAVYLGQLAIHPEYQGKKIGAWCLQEVEKIARESGYQAIRFDCVERHPWLCKFYEKAGYTRKNIVALPEPTGNVICFEKSLY